MANTIRGRIHRILDVETRNSNGKDYTKQAVILDCTTYDQFTGEPRSNFPKLEFNGDKGLAEIAKCRIGSLIEVSFALNGAMYEKNGEQKNFTVVRGYKIELVVEQQPGTQAGGSLPPMPTKEPEFMPEQSGTSDDESPF